MLAINELTLFYQNLIYLNIGINRYIILQNLKKNKMKTKVSKKLKSKNKTLKNSAFKL